MFPISFGSDNHSGIDPKVLQALVKANEGYCPAYGDDELTREVLTQIKSLFGANCDAWLVMTGTGANVLSLQVLIKPYQAVICAASAHINVDECGAVQKNTQARLLPVETQDGKLTPELIAPKLLGDRDQHHSLPKIVSISQSTEYGTLYSLSEIRALADYAHAHNMLLHIDGARLANAAAALNCSFREMTADCKADIVSLGGTKNGMLFGEAIVSFVPELTHDMRFYRKQGNQLFSKMRFIAAQFKAYLHDELWRTNALHANKMAKLLARKLEALPNVMITQKVMVNSLFVILPAHIVEPLQKKYHFYTWDETRHEVRLMCSFNTTEAHLDSLIADIRSMM